MTIDLQLEKAAMSTAQQLTVTAERDPVLW